MTRGRAQRWGKAGVSAVATLSLDSNGGPGCLKDSLPLTGELFLAWRQDARAWWSNVWLVFYRGPSTILKPVTTDFSGSDWGTTPSLLFVFHWVHTGHILWKKEKKCFLKSWLKGKRERMGQIDCHSLVHSPNTHNSQRGNRELGTQPRCPGQVAGAQWSGHHLPSPTVPISRELESAARAGNWTQVLWCGLQVAQPVT